jgi:hypothetical protein
MARVQVGDGMSALLNWRTRTALAIASVLAATHWFAYGKGASRDAKIAQLKATYATQQTTHATTALTAQQQVDKTQEVKKRILHHVPEPAQILVITSGLLAVLARRNQGRFSPGRAGVCGHKIPAQ